MKPSPKVKILRRPLGRPPAWRPSCSDTYPLPPLLVETRELGRGSCSPGAGKPRSVASSVLAAIALVNWHVIWLAGGPELDSDEA